MGIINEAEYRKLLKSGNASGAYVFFGAEDYLKSYAVKATREALGLDEAFAFFNDVTIDFPDFSINGLLSVLDAPPMMADKKLVVLKSFDLTALKPSVAEDFIQIIEKYGKDELNLIIISIVPDGIDAGYLPKRPSPILKRISAAATAVWFEPSNTAKLSVWVARHFEHDGIKISERTAKFMVEYCGTSMMELASEINKLSSYLHANGRDSVNEEDIRLVSVPTVETEQFALSNAILEGNKAKLLEAIAERKFRQVEPSFVMAEIAGIYTHLYLVKILSENGMSAGDISKAFAPYKNYKINEFVAMKYIKAVEKVPVERLKRWLELCLDADLGIKTYGKRNYEQIEKLVCLL